jgi:hypothetical protein
MGDAYTHISVHDGTYRSYGGEDASHGAVAIYGLASGAGQDVGVAHWKWAGTRDEYSVHSRCVVRGVSRSTVDGEPVFRVVRGASYDVEFTLENNGRSTQRPRVELYVSSNDRITRSDRLMASRRPTLNRNVPFETTQRLTIPADLVAGDSYCIGVIVDADDAISETDENNNKSYIRIEVR